MFFSKQQMIIKRDMRITHNIMLIFVCYNVIFSFTKEHIVIHHPKPLKEQIARALNCKRALARPIIEDATSRVVAICVTQNPNEEET